MLAHNAEDAKETSSDAVSFLEEMETSMTQQEAQILVPAVLNEGFKASMRSSEDIILQLYRTVSASATRQGASPQSNVSTLF